MFVVAFILLGVIVHVTLQDGAHCTSAVIVVKTGKSTAAHPAAAAEPGQFSPPANADSDDLQ